MQAKEENEVKINKKVNILIGTDNKGKIEGAKKAFLKYFKDIEINYIKVSSEVNDQPIDEEILKGARNRISKLKERKNDEVDFYISCEAGLIRLGDKWININLALVVDKNGYESVGTSQGFMIPENKVNNVKEKSLGVVMDEILNGKELNKYKGGIYILSKEKVNRVELVENSFTLALVPYLEENKNIWK